MPTEPPTAHEVQLTPEGPTLDGTLLPLTTLDALVARLGEPRTLEAARAVGRDTKARQFHVFDRWGCIALEDHRSDDILALTFVLHLADVTVERACPQHPCPFRIRVGEVELNAEFSGDARLFEGPVRFESTLGGLHTVDEAAPCVYHLTARKRRNRFGKRRGTPLLCEVAISRRRRPAGAPHG